MRAGGRSVFVTHGGAQIGLGHVKRCLALATALLEAGDAVTFVVSPDSATARFIESAGLSTVVAAGLYRAGFSVSQRTWEPGGSELSSAVGGGNVDTAIVDAYTARAEHFEALRPVAVQLVAIDDTATRRLPVDVVVNVGAGTESLRNAYDVCEHTRLLLGSRYALLDPVYGEAPVRSHRTKVERVLVTLGASVHTDALRSAVTAVDVAFEGIHIGVVSGPFGAPGGMIGAATPGRNKVIDYGGLRDLRQVMLDADLAVTGAGVTLSELAATATPAVMIQTEPIRREMWQRSRTPAPRSLPVRPRRPTCRPGSSPRRDAWRKTPSSARTLARKAGGWSTGRERGAWRKS